MLAQDRCPQNVKLKVETWVQSYLTAAIFSSMSPQLQYKTNKKNKKMTNNHLLMTL